jgi:hypothetical protein
MNWKSGLFRVWLVASACWIAPVAWVAYVIIVNPYLAENAATAARQPFIQACLSNPPVVPTAAPPTLVPIPRAAVEYLRAHADEKSPFPADRNVFSCFDGLAAPYRPLEDFIPSKLADFFPPHGIADSSLIPIWTRLAQYIAFAAWPPLAAILLWWIGLWIAAGFRRTTS